MLLDLSVELSVDSIQSQDLLGTVGDGVTGSERQSEMSTVKMFKLLVTHETQTNTQQYKTKTVLYVQLDSSVDRALHLYQNAESSGFKFKYFPTSFICN